MKKIFLFALSATLIISCGDADNDHDDLNDDDTVTNPQGTGTIQPSEAIPDTMTISRDSVIVPDSANRNNNQPQ